MPQNTYRISSSFVIPLAIDVVLLVALFILSLVFKGTGVERAVLALILLPAFFVLAEAVKRTITVSDTGLEIRKFFRTKALAWQDITHIGYLRIRAKIYILLTTTKGFYIVSNAYDRFPQLVRNVIDAIPSEAVEIEDEVRVQINQSGGQLSNIVAAWIAATVLTGIIYLKLFS
ncbi:MAG: hypothetical protein CSYNP_01956 [Syntrophus sp. SKADARSKE-3]|nr:hypothetical protein [Syntrophus sp. SKADARSKE-3]